MVYRFDRWYSVEVDGVPFYNDIFLDLIVSDSSQAVEDNRDEFESILRKCVINYLGQKNIEQKYTAISNKNGNKAGVKKELNQ